MVPDNGLTRIELEILGRTDLYHVDYGSTEDWETTLPWTSWLPKSAIREDYGGRDPLRFASGVLQIQPPTSLKIKATPTKAVAIRVGANGLEPSTSRM